MYDANYYKIEEAIETLRRYYDEVLILRRLLVREEDSETFALPGTNLRCQFFSRIPHREAEHWMLLNDNGVLLDDYNEPLKFYSTEALMAFVVERVRKCKVEGSRV